MKILFTADWHIKLGQRNVPKDWQKNRFELLFVKIEEVAQEYDCGLVINGGDIFDRLPSMEELELYFEYIKSIKTPTMLYDGNHEATRKGSTFMSKLIKVTKSINENVGIVDHIYDIHNGIDFIPYCELHKVKNISPKHKILCTHVRGEIPPHVTPEIDLELLDKWEVVLAGDLHAYSNSQRNILYPGSPLSTSFHRTPINNGVIIFDTDTMQHEWIDLGLPQLIRKTVNSEEEMIATTYNHTIYELAGNVLELANVEHELLDKKLVKKESKARMEFSDTKTVEEELALFLKETLSLNEKEIANILTVFYDYT